METETKNNELLRGGQFLVKETKAEDVFTPEDFSEEQKMMRDSVKEFLRHLDHHLDMEEERPFKPHGAAPFWQLNSPRSILEEIQQKTEDSYLLQLEKWRPFVSNLCTELLHKKPDAIGQSSSFSISDKLKILTLLFIISFTLFSFF